MAAGAILFMVSAAAPQRALAAPLDWGFGASPRAQAIYVESRAGGQGSLRPGLPTAASSPYNDGDFVGTLVVQRLGRRVGIYEGETMANMDKGAGRFSFSGLDFGNMGLIGHNRGRTNGFFDFVRLLEYGDSLVVETSNTTRTYTVSGFHLIEETDFSLLSDFGDNRLTLVTCMEYMPGYRRVAVARRD